MTCCYGVRGSHLRATRTVVKTPVGTGLSRPAHLRGRFALPHPVATLTDALHCLNRQPLVLTGAPVPMESDDEARGVPQPGRRQTNRAKSAITVPPTTRTTAA